MKKFTPQKVNNIVLIILIIGLLIAMFGLSRDMLTVIVIGMAVMISSIIFKVLFYRCPHCWKYLDRSSGDFCPYCGKEVNNTEK